MTHLRGKEMIKSDLTTALGDFHHHAHHATFSRKGVRDGEPNTNYYSRTIEKMNDREAVNKRMKGKLKRIRKNRYDSLVTERDVARENYIKHVEYILECQRKLKEIMI